MGTSILFLLVRGLECSLEVVHHHFFLYFLKLDLLLTIGFIYQIGFRLDEDDRLILFFVSYFIRKSLDKFKLVALIGCAADYEWVSVFVRWCSISVEVFIASSVLNLELVLLPKNRDLSSHDIEDSWLVHLAELTANILQNQGWFTCFRESNQDYLDIGWLLVHLAGHHSRGSGQLRVALARVTKSASRRSHLWRSW